MESPLLSSLPIQTHLMVKQGHSQSFNKYLLNMCNASGSEIGTQPQR